MLSAYGSYERPISLVTDEANVIWFVLENGVEVCSNGLDMGAHNWCHGGHYVQTKCPGTDKESYTIRWEFEEGADSAEDSSELPWGNIDIVKIKRG